jgi:hypothetical protein
MRFLVIKDTVSAQALSARLFKGGASANAAALLARVKALNPHLDLQHIEAGTVLVLPDLPDADPKASESVGGDAFDALEKDIEDGLKQMTQRIRKGHERLKVERKAVEDALGEAPVKRALLTDPLLKQQLDEAHSQFDADQKRAKAAATALDALHKGAREELSALAQLFR